MATITILRDFGAVSIQQIPWEQYEEAGNESRMLFELVVNSLLTDRRADDEDELPVEGERRGWWADTYGDDAGFGSKLWLLNRATINEVTLTRAKGYAEEAVAWMIEDGVAAQVRVAAERHGDDGFALQAEIARNDGRSGIIRLADLWEGLN